MKKIVFSCAMVTVLVLTAFSVFGQEQAGAPTYKDGDFWQFKVLERDFTGQTSAALDGVYELSYERGKPKIFKVDRNRKIDLSAGGIPQQTFILRWMLGQGNYQGGQSLNFPLFVGKNWSFEQRARARGARKERPISYSVRVTGIENVTTPAGTFRSFKLVNENSSGPGSLRVFTYYYSPDPRTIIKANFDFSVGTGGGGKRDIELIKFGSAQ